MHWLADILHQILRQREQNSTSVVDNLYLKYQILHKLEIQCHITRFTRFTRFHLVLITLLNTYYLVLKQYVVKSPILALRFVKKSTSVTSFEIISEFRFINRYIHIFLLKILSVVFYKMDVELQPTEMLLNLQTCLFLAPSMICYSQHA